MKHALSRGKDRGRFGMSSAMCIKWKWEVGEKEKKGN